MHQGGEPRIFLSFCRLSYLLQRTGRVNPAQCPERVLLAQFPFGQTPPLHLLRRPVLGLVRRLLRYYGSVRLPVFVHHRILSLNFPIRPEFIPSRANTGSPGSRARCVLTCQGLRPRRTPSHLAWTMRRMLPSAWHHGVGVPESRMFRGSMPWPAISPVNASIPTLRLATHDSGPVWFATPSPYDSFIRFISPFFPGAQCPTLRQHRAKGWATRPVSHGITE